MKIVIFGISNKTQIIKYRNFAKSVFARVNKNKLPRQSSSLNIILVSSGKLNNTKIIHTLIISCWNWTSSNILVTHDILTVIALDTEF